jgi:hypothetical protein
MRIMALAMAAIVVGASITAGALAADPPPFTFSPEPRWKSGPNEEPETDEVCAAIKRECPGIKDVSNINADFGFDALYDVDGNLAGMRMTKSTGCTPLDESLLLSQRKFILAFHKDGQQDLDNIHAEVAPGVDRGSVRIVKKDGTSVSLGCNP